MKGVIDRYLDRVMVVADIRDPEREAAIRGELRDHLEQKAESLHEEGVDAAEALIKAIEDHGDPLVIGYQLRPWRFIDVRLHGTARGVIAIGPKARGVIAIGGLAIGFIAFGGLAVGAFSFGGLALGLLLAWGGLAGGAVAYGGLAVGAVAFGGLAVGGIAAGGGAAGLWVPGAGDAWWSHFTWGTVPHWWRGIGEWMSYNPASPSERAAFGRLMTGLTVATVSIVVLLNILQVMLTVRERKRVGPVRGIGSMHL